MSTRTTTKTMIALAISLTCILSVAGSVEAVAMFGVTTTVCAPSWYCTAFSEGSCGARTCVDTNICGTNINKPAEFLQCTEPVSKGGSKSSGGGGGYIPSNMIPSGYFTTDTDVIQLTVNQETVTQKIITINSTISGEYGLEIRYPSSYIGGNDFVTTSSSNKSIGYTGDFNIIVDARNVLAGTYIIPINISNKYYSKNIELIIDVVTTGSSNVDLSLDSKIKTISIDNTITARVQNKGLELLAGNNITYILMDPIGNILLHEERTIMDPSNIMEMFTLPPNMSEGYYTLSIKYLSKGKEYGSSQVFTVFAPEKYYPVLQSPQKTGYIEKNLIWIIVILVAVALIIFGVLTKDSSRRKSVGRSWRYRMMTSRPLINISFNAREKMRNFSSKFNIRKDIDERQKAELLKRRNEILRSTYERGFISITEYSAAIHSAGPLTESEKEHLQREEERHKREAAERKAREEKLLEEKKRDEERKNIEQEKKKLEEEKKRIEEDRRDAEERKEKEEKERQKEEREREEEKRRIEQAKKKLEEEKRKIEEDRRDTEEKEKKEEKEKEVKEKEKKRETEEKEKEKQKEERRREEEIEKKEKEAKEKKREMEKKEEEKEKESKEKKKEAEEIKEEKQEKIIEKREEKEEKQKEEHKKEEEEKKEEPEKKHETEKGSKTSQNIEKKSEILDKRARDEEAFVLNSNELLYSLRDFLNVLPHMSEHVLHHHIKHGRNDFANWIGDVFRYDDIAEEVRKAETKEEIIKILKQYE